MISCEMISCEKRAAAGGLGAQGATAPNLPVGPNATVRGAQAKPADAGASRRRRACGTMRLRRACGTTRLRAA